MQTYIKWRDVWQTTCKKKLMKKLKEKKNVQEKVQKANLHTNTLLGSKQTQSKTHDKQSCNFAKKRELR